MASTWDARRGARPEARGCPLPWGPLSIATPRQGGEEAWRGRQSLRVAACELHMPLQKAARLRSHPKAEGWGNAGFTASWGEEAGGRLPAPGWKLFQLTRTPPVKCQTIGEYRRSEDLGRALLLVWFCSGKPVRTLREPLDCWRDEQRTSSLLEEE